LPCACSSNTVNTMNNTVNTVNTVNNTVNMVKTVGSVRCRDERGSPHDLR
jgi:hypothetical protein